MGQNMQKNICVQLDDFAVYQKLTQHCKPTIYLSLKKIQSLMKNWKKVKYICGLCYVSVGQPWSRICVFVSTTNSSPWPQFPIFLSFLVSLVSFQPCFGNMTCPKLQVFNCLEGRNLFS